MNFSLNQTQRHRIQRRPARFNQRRGITLLFVISMVVLFLLMGTTFMIVTNDYYKASRLRSFRQTNVVDAPAVLDRAFYDLVRGPSLYDTSSPLRGQSILGDQYGFGLTGAVAQSPIAFPATGANVGATAQVGQQAVANGPFVNIAINASPVRPRLASGAANPDYNGFEFIRRMLHPAPRDLSITNVNLQEIYTDLENDPGYVDGIYGGQVLTFVSGALDGYSTRIIYNELIGDGANPQNNRLILTVLGEGPDFSQLRDNDRILINGREFSGIGAGAFATGTLASLTPTIEFNNPDDEGELQNNALLPNRAGEPFDPDYDPGGPSTNAINTRGLGYLSRDRSVNEPWDAPDFQNMFLAYREFDATGTLTKVIPSFHRDTLYQDRFAVAPGSARQFSFRPVYTESAVDTISDGSTANARFTTVGRVFEGGINGVADLGDFVPTAANTVASLDVDTDNDGQLDSVWIDIGLPTQTDSEGRQFRPLVAYQVIDMDGKLNVNAHGSYADLTLGAPPVQGRGAGYGVAEISLSSVVTPANYLALLRGRYEDQVFVSPGDPFPGVEVTTGNPNPSSLTTIGNLQKLYGNRVVRDLAVWGNLFSGGSDLYGQYSTESFRANLTLPYPDVLPDYRLSTTAPMAFITSVRDATPAYLADFSVQGSSGDSLFSAEELEAILRPYDGDSELLPDRLRSLVTPARRRFVTTDSFELAVPTTTRPLVERLNAILLQNGVTALAQRKLRVTELIPRDILLGGKMDINRPLGNGVDDDTDGVVDNEAGAVNEQTNQYQNPVMNLDNHSQGFPGALTNANGGRAGDAFAGELLAQDFYITALLATTEIPASGLPMAPQEFEANYGGTPAEAYTAYARMLAQWAVNMVDFRDPDSIMTRFRYDPNPYDGWAPGPTDVVWGAERPELLITETFASHDRATEDLDTDPSGEFSTNNGGTDTDWDSRHVPRTSAFFELYNPWRSRTNTMLERTPGEFGNFGNGVNLGALAAGDDPVWRIGIKRTKDATTFERAVYFTDVSGANVAALTSDGASTYFSTTLGTKSVRAGEYAVIGSEGNVGAVSGEYITTFGRLTSHLPGAINQSNALDVRNIRLNPGSDQVRTFDYDGTNITNVQTTDAKVIVLDEVNVEQIPGRVFSVSDPTGGYSAGGSVVDPTNEDGIMLNPPVDNPLDTQLSAADLNVVATNGLNDNFRFACLQRLADPTRVWDANTNPYLTIDVAGVDLFAFNSQTNNRRNTATGANNETLGTVNVSNQTGGDSNLRSAERGEQFSQRTFGNAGLYVAPAVGSAPQLARRNFFTSDDGEPVIGSVPERTVANGGPVADGHRFTYAFLHSFGELNSSFRQTLATTAPLGWLTWNNRPFANVAEVANVPYLSAEMMLYCFNRGNQSTSPLSPIARDEYYAYGYFGRQEDQHGHLLRFTQDNYFDDDFVARPTPNGVTASATAATNRLTNRMARVLDFLDSPNRFLGSETFLPVNIARVTSLPERLQFYPPFNTVPNFRYPGKVNLNTVSDMATWAALFNGTLPQGPMTLNNYAQFITNRDDLPGPTDVAGLYTSFEGGEYFPEVMNVTKKGSDLTIFRGDDPDDLPRGQFDVNKPAPQDSVGSAYFANEARQKLGAVATNRSSVFAIWITVGYFEVDEFNRLGAELGSEIGEVKRNRAFYMIDRSIPVAFEPGQNHNVDDIILTRTIIE